MNIDAIIAKIKERKALTSDEALTFLRAYMIKDAAVLGLLQKYEQAEALIKDLQKEIIEAERRSDYWQDLYEMYFNTWIERG